MQSAHTLSLQLLFFAAQWALSRHATQSFLAVEHNGASVNLAQSDGPPSISARHGPQRPSLPHTGLVLSVHSVESLHGGGVRSSGVLAVSTERSSAAETQRARTTSQLQVSVLVSQYSGSGSVQLPAATMTTATAAVPMTPRYRYMRIPSRNEAARSSR